MANEWRKCKSLNAGDKNAVALLDDCTQHPPQRFDPIRVEWYSPGFSNESMMHMVGLVKMLAARVVELETERKARKD